MISFCAIYQGCFAFIGSGYGSRKADVCVRSRSDDSISAWPFWMTGKWCWFHVKFLLSSVCFTLEIAKMLSAGAIIQSLFLSITDVGLTTPAEDFSVLQLVFSMRNKLQGTCWRTTKWSEMQLQSLLGGLLWDIALIFHSVVPVIPRTQATLWTWTGLFTQVVRCPNKETISMNRRSIGCYLASGT